MTHVIYWLDSDGDRTGLEIAVNSIPVERLMHTHGGRLPINEFLQPGGNRVELRRGLWSSNKDPDQGGEASLKLVKARFQNSVKLDEQIIVDQSATFEKCPPRSLLVAAAFAADEAPAPPPMGAFDPIGPAQQAMILDRLGSVAALWRAGDGNGLVRWMSHYLDDYVRAYPLESRNKMEDRIGRMAGAFRNAAVQFDRSSVLLNPIPGSNLVDCLGPEGAAVRVARDNGPDYDMWAVVGVRDGEVVLVR